MIGASLRGMPLDMFDEMNPGQIVDYCIAYNNLMDPNEDAEKEATQSDFDKF